MKLLASRYIFIFSLFLANHLHAHVALDYPLGGETFIVGQTILVQWHIAVPHETLNWDLYFSTDEGVNWTPLQLNMPVTQLTYEWQIPNNLTTQGRIRVFMNNVDQDYLDISMNFTIAPNTTPPFLDAPAEDITIECSINNQPSAIDAWLDNHGGASATNFCDNLVWTHDYTGISNGCGASGSTEVIFTAADACGFITTSATVTVADTQPPVISQHPSDMVVECNGSGNLSTLNAWLSNHGGAQASDDCGSVTWSHNYSSLSNECGGTGSATVSFTATDHCGNLIVTIANFSIEDHALPVITQQAQDTTMECNVANQETIITGWLNRQGGAQATDACGMVSWTNNYTSLYLDCGSSGVAEVTFRAFDDCANNVTTSAIIRIEDTTSPAILQQAKDIIIDCGNGDQDSVIQNWLDNHADAIVSDQCGTLTWSHDFNYISDSCVAPFSQLVIFTVADECLNTTILDATITFVDTIIPKPVGFLDSTYVWTENTWFANASQSFRFTFADIPSIISDTTYYELLRSDEASGASWIGTYDYFRFDNKRVFVRQGNHEGILFDFNLMEGDPFIELTSGIPLTVDKIDTIQLQNGELRKQWKLRCDKHQPGLPYEVLWVEGIGNLKGIFGQDLYCQLDGSHYEMLCMFHNDTLIYDNPQFEDCWILPTAIEHINESYISIYPNPATETITIDFEKAVLSPSFMTMTDILGKQYFQTKDPQGNTVLPVDSFSPGIYFINIELKEGVVTRKVIIE